MSKVAQYLQEHLIGEVMTSQDAREYFSTDGSIFKITPQIIVYPRAENDIRKAARFTWQLAERGRAIPLTSRGLGTDLGGGAIGGGIMLVFPAHMNKILALNSSRGTISVQPGLNFGRLQQTLQTHGLFLPPYPASLEYSTIGGAIANNAAGEKSIKYGVMKDYVRELRVVLSNGEVITTNRISKRDVNKKMGLANFEGEIYRTLDALLNENKELIEKSKPKVTKNTAGYDIWSIRNKDGSVDLTQLLVGSQGTLGIISEAKLESESFNPKTTLMIGYFDDISKAGHAILELRKQEPCALEMVDENLLNFLDKNNPNQLKGSVEKPFSKMMLFVEFDDQVNRVQRKKVRKARKILEKHAYNVQWTSDEHEKEDVWKIRHGAATVTWENIGNKKALPIIEDGIVPVEDFAVFVNQIYELFSAHNLEVAVWGHAGNANLHVQPFFDLSEVGDRQKIFKVMEEYYKIVISHGGSISAQDNDGRLRGPYLKEQYGEELYEVFRKIKQLFDPFNTLNPGVKIDVTTQDLQPIMRQDYSMAHFYDHMPRT
jgi:FAD/FMN-containing dehydrogenase